MSVVDKVFRDYGDFVLDFQNWTVLDQGVTALWGPSGSGKTSLIRSLLGLDPLAQVQWQFGKDAMADLSPLQKNLAVVFQELHLFPHMTARSNILFPVKKGQDYEPVFKKLVDTMELGDLLDRGVSQLSGGEKQRVAIARALIYRPRLVFLDEPFSSLDHDLRAKTRKMVLELANLFQTPMVLITHDPEDVRAMASKVTVMKSGRNAGDQSIAQFLQA